PHRRILERGSEPRLAVGESAPGRHLLGYDFAEQQRAADPAVGGAPRLHQPPAPVDVAVQTQEWVFLVSQFLARQHAGMDLPPARRNIGEYLVMRTADELDVWWQPEISNVAARGGQVTHLGIEHGNGGRRVLDEQCQLGLPLCKPRLRSLALRDVADDLRAADGAAFGISHRRDGD